MSKKIFLEITIDKPRSVVHQVIEDETQLQYCQDRCLKMEHLSGEPGTAGAESNLFLKQVKLKWN